MQGAPREGQCWPDTRMGPHTDPAQALSLRPQARVPTCRGHTQLAPPSERRQDRALSSQAWSPGCPVLSTPEGSLMARGAMRAGCHHSTAAASAMPLELHCDTHTMSAPRLATRDLRKGWGLSCRHGRQPCSLPHTQWPRTRSRVNKN